MLTFTEAQDRFLKAKEEHPAAQWPEILLRRQEARALVVEVHRSRAARAQRANA